MLINSYQTQEEEKGINFKCPPKFSEKDKEMQYFY